MTWPKAYNATLHGDIGDYRMLGTQKTYRFSFPDPLFPFGYGESPRSGARRPGCAQGALADLAFRPRRSGRALRAR